MSRKMKAGPPREARLAMKKEEMKKLFVGGLSWNTTDQGLTEAFEQFGEVTEAKVINDRDTGRSRGFGFVSFTDAADADAAAASMDGSTLDGRSIRVNEANDKPRRQSRDSRW
jgi:RNA recognition motif-containing protein